MAWYEGKASAGYDGGFYATTQNYVATTAEQVFEYRQGFGRFEPYKGHEKRDEPILMRWRQPTTRDQPLKNDGFYPKDHDHVSHMGLPWKKDASELSHPTIHDQSKDSLWNKDANPSRNGSPPNRDARKPSRVSVYEQREGLQQNRNASDPIPFTVYDQNKDAYKSIRFRSPPTGDRNYSSHDYGKNNEFSDDDDCKDGACYRKGGPKPINHLEPEDYDEEEHEGQGHFPRQDLPHPMRQNRQANKYALPTSQQKDLYHEPSTYNNNRPIANGLKPIKTMLDSNFPNQNPRNPPVSIGMQQPQYNGSPRKDRGYEQSIHNKAPPPTNPRNPPVSIGMQQPQYNGLPRKDHGYEQRIHNNAPPPTNPRNPPVSIGMQQPQYNGAYVGDKFKGNKIDAREAAKKYKGVLLTN